MEKRLFKTKAEWNAYAEAFKELKPSPREARNVLKPDEFPFIGLFEWQEVHAIGWAQDRLVLKACVYPDEFDPPSNSELKEWGEICNQPVTVLQWEALENIYEELNWRLPERSTLGFYKAADLIFEAMVEYKEVFVDQMLRVDDFEMEW